MLDPHTAAELTLDEIVANRTAAKLPAAPVFRKEVVAVTPVMISPLSIRYTTSPRMEITGYRTTHLPSNPQPVRHRRSPDSTSTE